MYQNISRKYRPQAFHDIVGQEVVVTTLKNAIKLGKIAPAYLFCGCRGTGKTTLARLFAKALNCKSLSDSQEPCNTCPSCLEITQGRSLDLLEIDGASNRGIDDIRQINETVSYASAGSKYKIYIIDEVHMLTKEAFNALLKTLEEPPSNVKFFFATTEPHKVLPTITSRCQRFDLHRLSPEQITKKLEQIALDLGVTVEKEALHLIATLAEGGLRDAESLFDQLLCYTNGPLTYNEAAQMLGVSPRNLYFRLDRALETYNLSFAFELAQEVFSSGKDLTAFLDGLIEHYRLILLLKMSLPSPSYLHDHDQKEYTRATAFYTQDHCLYILDYLMQWYKEIHKTPFKRITLEMLLLHLIRSPKRVSLPTLVRRLEALETGSSSIPSQRLEGELSSTPQGVKTATPLPSSESSLSPPGSLKKAPPLPQPPPTKTDLPSSQKAEAEPAHPELGTPLHQPISSQTTFPISSISDSPLLTPASRDKPPANKETPPPKSKLPSPSIKQIEPSVSASPALKQETPLEDIPLPFLDSKSVIPKPSPTSPGTTLSTESVKKTPEAPMAISAEGGQSQTRYDTLLRFAAVELEGIIKKD